jgi:hypothetical protein
MPEPDPSAETTTEDAFHAAAARVLEGAFVASSLGMPTEDARTAVDVMWASFEALVDRHFPAAEGRPGPPVEVPDGTHWSRILVTAVTNALLLRGTFIRPAEAAPAVEERARELRAGDLWHSRRPPGPAAVVLAVHADLLRLDETAALDRPLAPADAAAVERVVALSALGAVLAGEGSGPARRATVDRERAGSDEPAVESNRRAREMAVLFGVPGVELVAVERSGWACDVCGCVFVGRVDGGVAYPDRLAPVGRGGPCDSVTACACHAAPLQRRLD